MTFEKVCCVHQQMEHKPDSVCRKLLLLLQALYPGAQEMHKQWHVWE